MAPPNTPHVPTAAQLTQLATLQAAQAAAQVNLAAQIVTHTAAQITWENAAAATAQYSAYIYGGNKPNTIDEGGQAIT